MPEIQHMLGQIEGRKPFQRFSTINEAEEPSADYTTFFVSEPSHHHHHHSTLMGGGLGGAKMISSSFRLPDGPKSRPGKGRDSFLDYLEPRHKSRPAP